jgi:subtilisin family serine protease
MYLKKIRVLVVLTAYLISASAFADRYLVIAEGNSFSNKTLSGIEAAGGNIQHLSNEVGLALVESDFQGFQDAVQSVRGIRSAPHSISMQAIQPLVGELVNADLAEPPVTFDDDFFFDLQWGHDAIDAVYAWEKGHRGAGVRVAVLDSGIDADHPDIAPNLNLALSTSFVPGEPVDVGILQPGPTFNHGTHVAGTIAAADNAYGVIGVAVKVLSQFTGSGDFGGIMMGMIHAALIDADVVNMSLGGTVPRNCTFGEEHFPAWECAELWTAGNRVANFVRAQGTLIIASAGNSSRNFNKDKAAKEFPNDLPGVVSVSATAPIGWALDPLNVDLDNLASYSNYGTSGIDLAAPGGDFSYPGNELCFGPVVVQSCWVLDMVFSTINGDGWFSWSAGTSMAAPHATGVAALIIGANGAPMKPSKVVAAMKAGADDLGKPGKDAMYGHGRVNANSSTD